MRVKSNGTRQLVNGKKINVSKTEEHCDRPLYPKKKKRRKRK